MRLIELRNSNPEAFSALLAPRMLRRNVRRGIQWLNKNAPIGWQRKLFQPLSDGTWHFRAEMDGNTYSVPALAFEGERRFLDRFGYVNQYQIARHFDLNFVQQFALGFNSGQRYFSKGTMEFIVDIPSDMLKEAWIAGILAYDFGIIPYRHATDAEIGHLASIKARWVGQESPSLWDKIRQRFQLVFG